MGHYTGAELSCGLTGGCSEVLGSEYSVVFGVPVALGGAIYYLTAFILMMLYSDIKSAKVLRLVAPLTVLGLFASGYFLYIQAFVIGEYCQYCLLSAVTSTGLFILGLFTLKYKKLIK